MAQFLPWGQFKGGVAEGGGRGGRAGAECPLWDSRRRGPATREGFRDHGDINYTSLNYKLKFVSIYLGLKN